MKVLRKYQQEAVDIVMQKLHDGVDKQLVCFSTGLGKTLTAANIITKFPGRTLWITHTEELIEQSALAILKEEEFFSNELLVEIENKNGIINALKTIEVSSLFNTSIVGEDLIRFKEHIGIIKQDNMNIEAKVVVASIQTLWRRLDKIPADHFDLVIVDEAHFALARTWTKALEHFTPKLRLGLTATPYRLDGQSLKYLFDEIVVDHDIKFGIDNGFLCELDAIKIKTELNLDSVRTTGGELNEGDLEKIVDTPQRNRLIVNSYKKYADGRQALVFCVTVQHAINVHQAFADAGIVSSFVVGDEKLCPDRKERIARFKSGETTVLSNVMVLTAGFDHPECACVIMARPTKSLVVYLQAIGRGTRLKKGYKDCIILDIVDASSRHSLINSWTLDQDKQLEDKVFIGKEKKKELIEKRDAARAAKVLGNVKKDEKVNLFKVPKMREITSEKMQEPASEKQLAWIERLGYNITENEYTKAMCSDIISIQPISKNQRFFLQSNGYDVSGEITIGMFGEAKSEIEKRNADKLRTAGKRLFFTDLK